VLPGAPVPPGTSLEVYSWTTGGWRDLPPTQRYGIVDIPLLPEELNKGLVRLRTQTAGAQGGVGAAQLLLTSSSEAEMRILDIATGRTPPG